MGLRRPRGARGCLVALPLAAILTGAPQALRSTLEPEHRCGCPAGSHVCSCPRCAAQAALATAARSRCHGPGAGASGPRPPCHGGAATASTPARERPPPPDAPCVSAGCQGVGAVAAQPGGVEPVVLREHRAHVPRGRSEGFSPLASLTPVDPAAPEPPPPRA